MGYLRELGVRARTMPSTWLAAMVMGRPFPSEAARARLMMREET